MKNPKTDQDCRLEWGLIKNFDGWSTQVQQAAAGAHAERGYFCR